MTENPFHVLGLPVTASEEQVARQYERLAKRAGQAEQEQARLRRAWEDLRTNPLQRGVHELLEMPGTVYREREDEWRGLARENRKNPVDAAGLAMQAAPDLGSVGIDLRAVLELLAISLANQREAIFRDGVAQPPELPGAGAPPLRVADVVIGALPPAGPTAQTPNETAREKAEDMP
jgi:hypothetical protein